MQEKTSRILASLGLISAIVLMAFPGSAAFAQTVNPNYFNEPSTANTSLNWAGYVAQRGIYTNVHGTWTIPNVVNSGITSADASWVGIGGVTHKDLIQAGTEAILDQGQIEYQAWYELLPGASQTVPLNFKPGDVMTIDINETSQSVWNISFVDNTTGATYQTSVQYASLNDSAEWIEEMPLGASSGNFIPLDNFGSIGFRNASAIDNGAIVTPQSENASSLTMVDNNGQALATVSSLGADGGSFTVTRTSDQYNSSSNYGNGQRVLVARRFRGRQGNGVQGMSPQIVIYRGQFSGQIPQAILNQIPAQFQRFFTMQFSRY